MRTRGIVALSLSLSLSVALPALAEQIDAEAVIGKKLQSQSERLKGMAIAPDSLGQVFFQDLTFTHFEIRNIKVIGIDVSYGEVTPEAIPDHIEVDEFTAYNCTPTAYTETRKLTLQTAEGITVKITKSINTKSDVTANISFGKGSLGAAKSVSVSLNKDETVDQRETRIDERQVPKTVSPWSAAYVRAEKRVSSAFLPFSGQVLLEGDVYYSASFRTPLGKKERIYDQHLGKLSDLLPDRADRIISVEGEVWNATASKVRLEQREDPIDRKDPKACPTIPAR